MPCYNLLHNGKRVVTLNPIAEARETVAANLRHRATEELVRARKQLEKRTEFGDTEEIVAHMGAVLAVTDELERRQAA